jgi:Fic family protein
MDNNQNYIGQIKQVLIQTGWSQSRLALELSVTFATVNRWLNGHSQPQPSQIRSIFRIYRQFCGIIAVSQPELKRIFDQVEAKRKKNPAVAKALTDSELTAEFLLELTYNSDAIEGSTLTKKETEAVIFDKALVKDKALIEHLEAVNHAQVLKDIFAGKLKAPVTEELIKYIHKILLQGIRDDAGEYSKHQRAIRGVDLILPHPDDVPQEMQEFIAKVNKVKQPVLEHVAKMHADFEAIHPFGDGNGRVGRLLVNIQLLSYGLAPALISANEKARYYECLEYAQKKSASHLTVFLAQSVLKSYAVIEKYKKHIDK